MSSLFRLIRAVFSKELEDHSRDRRSMLGALILPIVGPLVLLGLIHFIAGLKSDRALEVPVVGADNAPALIAFLEEHGVEIQPAPKDAKAKVLAGEIDVVLQIGDQFQRQFRAGRSARVSLLVDDSNNQARGTAGRVEALLHQYSRILGAQRLIARGIAPEVAKPLKIAHVNLASREKLTAQLLNVIPLMLMMAALMGGMNIAIDATAGERERGSLEPLLLNPVPRSALVLGKWLATVSSATVIVLIATGGFVWALRISPLEQVGLKIVFGGREALIALFLVAPLVLLGAALQMLVATFARSFKEAQTYLGLLNMLPMIPSMVLMMNPGKIHEWMLLVPGLAQVIAVGDLLRGQAPSLLRMAACWTTGLALTAVSLAVVVRLFGREKIVFGR